MDLFTQTLASVIYAATWISTAMSFLDDIADVLCEWTFVDRDGLRNTHNPTE